jgi:hypothetical protein
MADLSIVDLRSVHAPFDAIRGRLDIGTLFFLIDFYKIKDPVPQPF